MPARSAPGRCEKSAPVRPYSVPFAMAIASSKSRALMHASTGPKISSWASRAYGFTSPKIVGAMK